MPSIDARLSSSSALDTSSLAHRPDRKSADAIYLQAAASGSTLPVNDLTRVNSTPLSADGLDALSLQSPGLNTPGDEDPASILTIAPPKPSPADTLYPSPSGGFVPSPEEGQDWRLKPPPPGRSALSSSTSPSPAGTRGAAAAATSSSTSTSHSSSQETDASLPSTDRPGSTSASTSTSAPAPAPAPARPPSLPISQETASRIAGASSSNPMSRRNSSNSNAVSSPQLRPQSTSSTPKDRHSVTSLSSSSAVATGSAAAAAANPHPTSTGATAATSSGSGSLKRKSTSNASLASPSQDSAKDRQRMSSRLSRQVTTLDRGVDADIYPAEADKPSGSAVHASAASLAPVIIRDFAFSVDDPRYLGEPLSEPAEESHYGDEDSSAYHDAEGEAGSEFYVDDDVDDEQEFGGDEGDAANIAEGVYRVLYEFEPVSEHELAVQPDEVVHVVGSIEGGWAIAIKDGHDDVKGLVPATYLEWVSPLP
ncbi:hypothetical protein BCV70DRAFT_25749 [Testicularia cyperi]|uniref:SH3 domain-containing protein n=1 Tax=Testicularia cyperi TaxID=1882483 RepID=A0A317XK47_9BASI|nr:hypothetical protein BCV70DRAFT_25749 [Testicularia cyperi]